MKPNAFFTHLQTYLKTLTLSGNYIFGDNVFLVPDFPAQQISTFISPTCFIVDGTAQTYMFHPRLLEQNFSVGFWYEKVADRYGDQAMKDFMNIEETLYQALRTLKSLNSEKLLIIEKSKETYKVTQHNYPLLSRYWSFSVILEV